MVLFGTDGIRGRYPEELTPAVFEKLGIILAEHVLADHIGRVSGDASRDVSSTGVVLGYDSRLTAGDAIPHLISGLHAIPSFENVPPTENVRLSENPVEIHYLGIAPTPLVAYFSRVDSLWGISITASHSPHPYCGVKIFTPGGKKLDSSLETQLEQELANQLASMDSAALSSTNLSTPTTESPFLVQDTARFSEYYEWLASSISEGNSNRDLSGLSVLVDAANGAVSALLPQALSSLGAEVSVIHGEPDGININQACGSTHPQTMADALRESPDHFDAGLMFDGDGDRLLACTKSRPLDGDEILAILATDLKNRNRLPNNVVVATVMSNLGFLKAMDDAQISYEITPVGDKHVYEAMLKSGAALGGEQSGHIIFGDSIFGDSDIFGGLTPTGDGLLTAIQLLDVLKRSRQSLEELASQSMSRVPQVLLGVEISTPAELIMEKIKADIQSAQAELGANGRVLIRPSQTESVLRIMVEGHDLAVVQVLAENLAEKARLADHQT